MFFNDYIEIICKFIQFLYSLKKVNTGVFMKKYSFLLTFYKIMKNRVF